MKKFLSMILALALVLSLGTVAFAEAAGSTASSANITQVDTSNKQEINVSLEATVAEPTASYYVTIKWDSMQFKFDGSDGRTWNHETHDYVGAITGNWTGGGERGDSATSNVTITNHSNVGVKAKSVFASDHSYENGKPNATNGAIITVSGESVGKEEDLGAGTLSNVVEADTNETNLTVAVTGTPKATIKKTEVAATITITITAADA